MIDVLEMNAEILRWFEHVNKRKKDYVGRKMLNLGLPGKRKTKGKKDKRV